MIKGQQREQKESKGKQLFVGFTTVRLVAVNPSREELNELLKKEPEEGEKEIKYLSQDQEGNDKLRMTFWLYDEERGKYFVHSFNMIDKVRVNKDGTKVQLVNSTCSTTWVPFRDKDSQEPDQLLIPDWFTTFTSRENKEEIIGNKKWRKAIVGEEELVTLVSSWLGKLNYSDPDTEVLIDTKKLFAENYKEIRSMIEGQYDTPFTALIGVETDESDATKKYQKVYGKRFLPAGYMGYIKKGNKFPSDYSKKLWKKFEDEVKGAHGFQAFFKLEPLSEYDESEDIAGGPTKQAPAPTTSEY